MDNKLLTRAISAFDSAGFEVKLVAYDHEKGLDLFGVTHNGKILPDPVCEKEQVPETMPKKNARFPGESYDIRRIVGSENWREAVFSVCRLLQEGGANQIHVGDFLYVYFEVPAAEYAGVKFPKLEIVSAKVVVVERTHDKIFFNFDEIIFKSAVNANDTNEKGFSESALAKYLNGVFLEAMGIKDCLLFGEGCICVTLPTAHELFGDAEYWEAENNFTENAYQFNHYKNEKNRVKVFENETHWYWTSSARASSAASFCYVNNYGSSNYLSGHASSAGGVAPAFFVA